MRVKICGITNYDDAMNAITAGADALGFVFYEKSPRYINPEDAALIIDRLPPFVEKVGLFVNHSALEINNISLKSHITLAQIHFEADKETLSSLNIPFIEVKRVQSKEELSNLDDSYYLVDAYCEAYGGVGKRINLEWFEHIDCSKIILAGGLGPDNIHEIAPFGFYGADVSSSVEVSKGLKDAKKVEAFISKAKAL